MIDVIAKGLYVMNNKNTVNIYFFLGGWKLPPPTKKFIACTLIETPILWERKNLANNDKNELPIY